MPVLESHASGSLVTWCLFLCARAPGKLLLVRSAIWSACRVEQQLGNVVRCVSADLSLRSYSQPLRTEYTDQE